MEWYTITLVKVSHSRNGSQAYPPQPLPTLFSCEQGARCSKQKWFTITCKASFCCWYHSFWTLRHFWNQVSPESKNYITDNNQYFKHFISIIGRSCHKYHFCHNKHVFVVTKHLFGVTKVCLSRKTLLWCDKNMFVATNLLSRQIFIRTNMCLSRQKWYLHNFVATKAVICCDKHAFVTKNICCDRSFVTTKIVCHDKHNFVTTKVLS